MKPNPSRIATRWLNASPKIVEMTQSQLRKTLIRRKERKVTGIGFLDDDDLGLGTMWQDVSANYIVALDGEQILGMLAYYDSPTEKQSQEKLVRGAKIQGRLLVISAIAIHPANQRQGLAGSLADYFLSNVCHPGDIVLLHLTQDGAAFHRKWLPQRNVNVLFGDFIQAYAGYDPSKVNYWALNRHSL